MEARKLTETADHTAAPGAEVRYIYSPPRCPRPDSYPCNINISQYCSLGGSVHVVMHIINLNFISGLVAYGPEMFYSNNSLYFRHLPIDLPEK